MNTSQVPQRGTVADRIRAFQDVEQIETKALSFGHVPRVTNQAKDSGQGRRKDSISPSPTGRASRDGFETFRGDGRPSVASAFSSQPATVGKEVRQEVHDAINVRPFTSMEVAGDGQAAPRRETEVPGGPELRRKHRSMEAVSDPTLEITTARSRLRSVAPIAPNKDHVETSSRSRADTLAELGHMLDDAIEDSASRPGVRPGERTGDLAPKPGFVLRRQTIHRSRRQSQPRGPSSRKSNESIAPRSSEESARVPYEDLEKAQPADQPDADSKDTEISSPSLLNPNRQALQQRITELSPVKQRAAMFESLVRRPMGHDETCQHFSHGSEASHGGQPPGKKETRKMHRLKVGRTIEERPGTPLIPLTLPQMVTQEKSSRPGSAVRARPEGDGQQEPVEEQAPIDDVFGDRRKTSVSWPFRWSIFNKSPSAPPQETEPQSIGDEAKDVHYPTTRPSVVKSKVQNLLLAANEKDHAERRRRQSERERLSRKQSRGPTSARQTEPKENDTIDRKGSRPPQLPPLQLEMLDREEAADDAQSEPKTPLHRAMTEKQVLSPPVLPETENVSDASSQKSIPHTPVRRRGRSFHRLSASDQQHAVEQHFNLSPGPSRSGSKSRGLKVEVEVRDSPERDARERGDKIVIIRANVATLDDDE